MIIAVTANLVMAANTVSLSVQVRWGILPRLLVKSGLCLLQKAGLGTFHLSSHSLQPLYWAPGEIKAKLSLQVSYKQHPNSSPRILFMNVACP